MCLIVAVLAQVVLAVVTGASMACLIWLKYDFVREKLVIATITVQGATLLFQFSGLALQMAEFVATISERRERKQFY